jgi:hypothetical protein
MVIVSIKADISIVVKRSGSMRIRRYGSEKKKQCFEDPEKIYGSRRHIKNVRRMG